MAWTSRLFGCIDEGLWVGCLDALTKAYEYVIEHLHQFSQSEKTIKNRNVAADLYQRLTSYDNFLFIFLYRDLTEQLAITSKWLQEKKLMIRDVGRRILNLNERLIGSYPAGSVVPVPLINTGKANVVLKDLFGEDLSCKSKSIWESVNCLDILKLEEDLLPTEPELLPVETSEPVGRVTRKLILTGMYSGLLSKKAREEFVQESNSEVGVELAPPVEPEVLVLISSVNS